MDYAQRVELPGVTDRDYRYFPLAGPLAYGLQLIDDLQMGFLFEMMNAARVDPKYQADVAFIIDRIEPGLYRKLRDLPYTPEGIVQFVCHIGEAIAKRYDD